MVVNDVFLILPFSFSYSTNLPHISFSIKKEIALHLRRYHSNPYAMQHQQVIWDFHIDKYINRFIPRPRLDVLPIPISWFLGYRAKPKVRIGSSFVWVWAFIGAFLGLLVIEAVFQTEVFKSKGTPVVIASFVSSLSICLLFGVNCVLR